LLISILYMIYHLKLLINETAHKILKG